MTAEWDGWRNEDEKSTDSGQVGPPPRALSKTILDCSLRCVERAGTYVVDDEDGDVWVWDAQELDRFKRYRPLTRDLLHDVFEQKMLWFRQTLTATFAAGEWELKLHLEGGDVVVAYGSLEGSWSETAAQDIPDFHVAQLPRLIERVQAQIGLRKQYMYNIS